MVLRFEAVDPPKQFRASIGGTAIALDFGVGTVIDLEDPALQLADPQAVARALRRFPSLFNEV